MWICLSILASITSAIYYLSIQNVKLNSNVFMVYRGLFPLVLLLPVLIFNPVVMPASFYIMSFINGLIASYNDNLSFKINKKYGSAVVSSITPFSVPLTFIIWSIMDIKVMDNYINNPLKTFGIVISFAGIIISVVEYRKVNFIKEAAIKLVPVIVLSSCLAILNKTIMNYSGDHSLICACQYMLISSSVVGFSYLCIYKKKKLSLKYLILPNNLLKGTVVSFLVVFVVLKNIAMYYTENPAYVSCLLYTTIIWILILGKNVSFFKFSKANRQGATKWKILFVMSVVLLVMATK